MIRQTVNILRSSYIRNTLNYCCRYMNEIPKEEELKVRLTPLQYHVTQEKALMQSMTVVVAGLPLMMF
ncbi:hypothetical protein Trydic_g17215 [Trypoxylus dichotomus]